MGLCVAYHLFSLSIKTILRIMDIFLFPVVIMRLNRIVFLAIQCKITLDNSIIMTYFIISTASTC